MERRPLRSIALTVLAVAISVTDCSCAVHSSSSTAALNEEVVDKSYDYAVNVGNGEGMINTKPGNRVDFACAFDVPVGTLTTPHFREV